MKWRRDRIAPGDGTLVRRTAALLGAFWDVVTWGYLALLSVVAVSRMVDGAGPVVLEPLQAGLPLLFAPVLVVLGVAVVSRRWFQVPLAAILAFSFIAAVAPARRVVAEPYWVRGAASVRVVSANLFVDNPDPDAAVRAVLARDADVMVLLEFTDAIGAALQRAGAAARYPYATVHPRADPGGVAVFSKVPFDDSAELTELKTPAVRLRLLAGGFLWLAAVHPFPPTSDAEQKRWVRSLRALRSFSTGVAGDDPLALVGDFNATRWQPSFGRLLAGSMIDAHEARGKGLSRSWPVSDSVPRLVRLDHALVNERAFPTVVEDFPVPGSDHVGFAVTIAAKPLKAPGVDPGGDSIVPTTTRKPKRGR